MKQPTHHQLKYHQFLPIHITNTSSTPVTTTASSTLLATTSASPIRITKESVLKNMDDIERELEDYENNLSHVRITLNTVIDSMTDSNELDFLIESIERLSPIIDMDKRKQKIQNMKTELKKLDTVKLIAYKEHTQSNVQAIASTMTELDQKLKKLQKDQDISNKLVSQIKYDIHTGLQRIFDNNIIPGDQFKDTIHPFITTLLNKRDLILQKLNQLNQDVNTLNTNDQNELHKIVIANKWNIDYILEPTMDFNEKTFEHISSTISNSANEIVTTPSIEPSLTFTASLSSNRSSTPTTPTPPSTSMTNFVTSSPPVTPAPLIRPSCFNLSLSSSRSSTPIAPALSNVNVLEICKNNKITPQKKTSNNT